MKAFSRLAALCGLGLACGLSSVVSAAEAIPVMINNSGIAFSRMQDGQVIAYDPVAAYDEHAIQVADCNAEPGLSVVINDSPIRNPLSLPLRRRVPTAMCLLAADTVHSAWPTAIWRPVATPARPSASATN